MIPLGRRCASPRRAIDRVEFVIGFELRMQGQPQQTALFHSFAERNHFFAQIQKWLVELFAFAVQKLNGSGLLREKKAA